MGIPQVWEKLKQYTDNSRVPFKKFVADFYQERNRSPRIAIDCYQWLYECGFFIKDLPELQQVVNEQPSKPILNFISRIRDFLSLDITFILVFDGPMKPSFKNKHKLTNSLISNETLNIDLTNYKELWDNHLKSHLNFDHCMMNEYNNDTRAIKELKKLLKLFNISFIDSCGEAEAQCSWLQKNNFVDFVLSNDSDNILFGCTKILKNYSRYREDIGSTHVTKDNRPVRRNSKETYVTVVDMDKIALLANERFDKPAILLLTVFLGADYNKGIKGLGKEKSIILSSLRNPDFSNQFLSIFNSLNTSDLEQESKYQSFQQEITEYSRNNSLKLFGRNYKSLFSSPKLDGWPSKTAIMYYVNPFVIPNFEPSCFSKEYTNISGSSSFIEIDYNPIRNFLNDLEIKQIAYFDKWFCETLSISFLLKFIKLPNNNNLCKYMEIIEERVLKINNGEFEIDSWKIGFNPFLEKSGNIFSRESTDRNPIHVPHKDLSDSSRSLESTLIYGPTENKANKSHYLFYYWIAKNLIPKNNDLISNFYIQRRNSSPRKLSPKRVVKKSPSKAQTVQKNNLDSFLSKHASPIKIQIGTIFDNNKSKPYTTNEDDSPVIQPHKEVRRKLFVEEIEDDYYHWSSDSDSPIVYEQNDIVNKIKLSPKKERNHAVIDLTEDNNFIASNENSPLKEKKLSSEVYNKPNILSKEAQSFAPNKPEVHVPMLNKSISFLDDITTGLSFSYQSSSSNGTASPK
ncbi:hypothetical protein TPHA_0A05940 [Tetrapisispora phaffii CBS 4417]|uniref:XPG-I domain-containing protein n=1 Tax=Tetrapisispora phaffii (strain ATCC 24235 / CBS 4417 / NBRC 1672 / NRRL Y-8282 / UCD 70-5) TaxID=1071381 RepID=G8BP40_TETPH|nr:hypothetical protein TPHA_0A05940 [Tetrapisispora phaffii CBS 4417]CCE61668.1 hypothetical protein TPHA_0A05940 [Tetrapisispora phaffii CBS 4417]